MAENAEKKKKTRSPNYPSITLGRALKLTQTLLDKYGRHDTPWDVAIKGIGSTPKSSVGMQMMASLSYYGFVDIKGVKEDRKVKISDSAFKILMDKRPESPERDTAIREAALKPTMFKKIVDQFPDNMPANDVLEYELVVKYNFNPASVKDFIKKFRQTMDFAKIYESGIIGEETPSVGEHETPEEGDKSVIKQPISPPVPPKGTPPVISGIEREIANYPVGQGLKARIIISGQSPVTLEAVEKLITLLEINKEDLPETTAEKDKNEVDEPSDS
jgi:hypothetical protein